MVPCSKIRPPLRAEQISDLPIYPRVVDRPAATMPSNARAVCGAVPVSVPIFVIERAAFATFCSIAILVLNSFHPGRRLFEGSADRDARREPPSSRQLPENSLNLHHASSIIPEIRLYAPRTTVSAAMKPERIAPSIVAGSPVAVQSPASSRLANSV